MSRHFRTIGPRIVLTLVLAASLSLPWSPASAESSAETAGNDVFSTIARRIGDDIRAGEPSIKDVDRRVAESLSQLRQDGSFPDIAYANKAISDWPPNTHLSRITDMSIAYTTRGSSYYGKRDLRDRIEHSLEYWCRANPGSNNWWHNQIAVPKAIGRILILMQSGREPLSTGLTTQLVTLMAGRGVPERQTGANKVDIAMHYMYRACITHDAELMDRALVQIFQPLAYVTGEGIQHDNSYLQHGPQLYIGGYGNALVGGISEIASHVAGTRFALSGERLDIFSRFVREAYLKTIRGGSISYNVMGRGLTRQHALDQRHFITSLRRMALIDPAHRQEYGNAILRIRGTKPPHFGIGATSTHYYRSDYTLHQRPLYLCDVRTVSRRTARSERGNGEGLKNYFLADGSMSIQVRGNEYNDIFPVWDWARIPGVTCPYDAEIPRPGEWSVMGTVSFAGGVSNGTYSVSAYDYNDRFKDINTSAKKSWFFFDDEIVCLGSGIRSESEYPVNTSVNQCLLSGPVTASSRKREKTFAKGTHSFDNNVDWILHAGVGYYFPKGGNIVLKTGPQEGSWASINTGYSKDVVSRNVFSLWIDHGQRPQQAGYAYMVLPGKFTPADMRAYQPERVEIMENSDTVQAVYHNKLDILQIVFWQPATLANNGFSIKAGHPCVMMITHAKTSRPVLFLADPTQTLDQIDVEIGTPELTRPLAMTCDLSGPGHEAGKTRTFELTHP